MDEQVEGMHEKQFIQQAHIQTGSRSMSTTSSSLIVNIDSLKRKSKNQKGSPLKRKKTPQRKNISDLDSNINTDSFIKMEVKVSDRMCF